MSPLLCISRVSHPLPVCAIAVSHSLPPGSTGITPTCSDYVLPQCHCVVRSCHPGMPITWVHTAVQVRRRAETGDRHGTLLESVLTSRRVRWYAPRGPGSCSLPPQGREGDGTSDGTSPWDAGAGGLRHPACGGAGSCPCPVPRGANAQAPAKGGAGGGALPPPCPPGRTSGAVQQADEAGRPRVHVAGSPPPRRP
jgi:hypothetical protein